jgi:hypothetical protein
MGAGVQALIVEDSPTINIFLKDEPLMSREVE